MKIIFAAIMLVIPCIACSAQVSEQPAGESTETAHQADKVCPYLVPYCPPNCKLVGGCPDQCVCDNGVNLCGSKACGANEYCCDSTTVGYECLPIGYMCPL